MVCGETSVLHAIENGVAGVPAVGAGLGVTVAVGESVGELSDVEVDVGVVDCQTQPVRAAALTENTAAIRRAVRVDVAIGPSSPITLAPARKARPVAR
ncbi:MAG: hypothetical protein JWN80_21 [Microbacteriaceae bacterium]|nr:hypothetical protein [Microbacteriaceae bacterium]